MPKKRKVVCFYESKLSFIRTSLRFYGALGVLEPQIYVVVERFGAENSSLLSGRLARNTESQFVCLETSKY